MAETYCSLLPSSKSAQKERVRLASMPLSPKELREHISDNEEWGTDVRKLKNDDMSWALGQGLPLLTSKGVVSMAVI